MYPSSHRVVVLTGATGALGRAVGRAVALRGHRVLLVGRDTGGLEDAQAELEAVRPDAAARVSCDLAALSSVRAAAAEIARRFPAVDALVHCAGVYAAARHVTRDGHELMLAVNHLAPALLTLALEEALRRAPSPRVVFAAMTFRRPLGPDETPGAPAIASLRAFALSKNMNASFARELAERWQGSVAVLAVRPRATRSALLRGAPAALRMALALYARAPERTAAPLVDAALSEPVPDAAAGGPGAPPGLTRAARLRLWNWSLQAINVERGPAPARELTSEVPDG